MPLPTQPFFHSEISDQPISILGKSAEMSHVRKLLPVPINAHLARRELLADLCTLCGQEKEPLVREFYNRVRFVTVRKALGVCVC